jgi:hypothetical protein
MIGEDVKVKFDNHRPEIFSCSASGDGDSRFLFIDDTNRFIAKLKKSKRVIIEALLYDNGLQQMEFGTQGFKWGK